MPKLVYDFTEGNKDLKDLLGGKGANLAEMTNIGLPVPPGFTITTEACRYYLQRGSTPEGLDEEIQAHLEKLESAMGRRLGDPADPLLVSVRSGAKFSMPGMMDTVLNIGLSDESVQGLAKQSGNERFAWDAYRRLIQMFGKTVLGVDGEHFEHAIDAAKQANGVSNDIDLDAGRPAEPRRDVQGHRQDARGHGVPAGPQGAGGPGHQRRVRLVEHPPGGPVPPPGAHPRRPGHGRQRGRDGVRQPRPGLGHRRGLHPRPGHRRPGRLRRLPAERPGRGRGGRHQEHRPAAGPGAHRQDLVRPADADHADAGEPLPRHVRHRVHRRARQAVDAADAGGQAHRRAAFRIALQFVDEGLIDMDEALARVSGDELVRADVPPVRHQRRGHQDRHRGERVPGRGGRQGRLRLATAPSSWPRRARR